MHRWLIAAPARRWIVVRCGLLLLTAALAWAASGTTAKALSADDLMGRWCGDTSTYEFTPTQLTVTFKDGSQPRILRIKSINIGDGWINVLWQDGGGTVFEDFTGTSMAQRANTSGDMGPRREFHRC